MELRFSLGGRALTGFGGDKEMVGISLEPGRDAQFGLAVAGRYVDVVDSVLQ